MAEFFTVGHSDRTIGEFLDLLAEARVDVVVDVRRLPGSRTFPWFDQEPLEEVLRAHGIGYRHELALTGRRPKQPAVADDVNAFWQNRSFHNYADWALSPEFRDGLARLRTGDGERLALMCSEAVWWRCHRRIIADHLLGHGEQVRHIMGAGHITEAELTDGALVGPDGTVTYPA